MTKIRIIIGSETGTAHKVAEAIEDALPAGDYQISLARKPTGDDLTRDEEEVLLICTSSTGAGELPLNVRPLYAEIQNTPPRIAGRRYGVISLGDSCFSTFGAAAGILDKALADIGAVRIGEPLMIDAMETFEPEEDAVAWVGEWVKLL